MKESLELLKKLNIDKSKYIVIATSGGPDSMALLYMLNNNGYKCICAHVNHNLRKVSDEEYKFVKKYCKENNIIFEGMKIKEYKNNKFTENEAREKRYNFFTKILEKYNSKILLTAHHSDDLIETIIMRILRGSNLNGLKGFSKVSNFKDYTIIRPLVYYTKDEIEKFVKENNIPYVIDESNKSKKYTRNRIRLDILPILKQENKHVHRKFLDFSSELEEANKFIDEIVNKEKNNNYNNNVINLELFNNLNIYIKKKELESILFDIYNDNINLINKKHINSIINLSLQNGNKELNLPKNIKVIKNYNTIKFKKEQISNNSYKYILKSNQYIKDYGTIEYINDTPEKSNYVIKLNSKEIKMPIIIRTIQNGDYIEVKNMNSRKKISRIFIDEKIEKEKRNNYPIVTDSLNNVLWIPGIKKSKFDCYNRGFYDIIIKYTKKGE